MAKSIIITGAAGNLGQTVVGKLLEEKYRLDLVLGPHDRPEHLPAGDYHHNVVDISQESAAREYVEQATERHDAIHAALLLVGGYAGGGFSETGAGELRKMFQLNFETAYFMARPLLEVFKQQGHGRFVFIIARSALRPEEGRKQIAYSLGKGLVRQLAELINAEGEPHGIVAHTIAFSTLDTPANRKAMPKADPTKWVSTEQAADTIAFLLSDAGQALRDPVLKLYGNA